MGEWHPITRDQPEPLGDVMVSVYLDGDEEPTVFMAYRRQTDPSKWVISGTAEEIVRGVYAYAKVMAAAPMPAHRAAA